MQFSLKNRGLALGFAINLLISLAEIGLFLVKGAPPGKTISSFYNLGLIRHLLFLAVAVLEGVVSELSHFADISKSQSQEI